ncbi:filamentous hemagglutinin, partial [Escherichia coli]|nr:filamentous hemagglutinin [Escherichia coli]
TAAVQGLAGGNLSAALAGGAAPYLAEVVKTMTTDPVTGEVNKAANVAAHAVVNAALAVAQGNNALAGAAGAATGEVVGMIATQMYGKPVSELSETEKQTVSTLATVAAGLAGGLVGESGASAVAGAQSGKTTVENNALSELVPPRVQQDTSLAIDLGQKGQGYGEINNAIDASHLGPSWGTEYKVKTNGKIEVSGGIGPALKGEMKVNNDYFSVSTGYTKEFGAKAGASIGIDFGPYDFGVFGDLNRDYSTSIGYGPGSVGLSVGQDGLGFSFSVGPSIGFTGSSTVPHSEKIEMNGDTTKEIYHYDFK